jgi:hypothetical protein
MLKRIISILGRSTGRKNKRDVEKMTAFHLLGFLVFGLVISVSIKDFVIEVEGSVVTIVE